MRSPYKIIYEKITEESLYRISYVGRYEHGR